MLNKKIGLVIPSLGKGGMERVMSILANEFFSSGCDVTILCILPDQPIEYKLSDGVKLISFEGIYKKGLVNKLQSFKFLLNNFKTLKFDYVISFGERFNPLVVLAAKVCKTKVFISDRSNPYKQFSRFQSLQRNLTYPMANGILAQTSTAKQILKKLNENVLVAPNPLRDFNDSYVKEGNKVIVTVGRLIDSKNVKELITIFSRLDRKEWELWILGDGYLRKDLESQVNKLGISDRVTFYGTVNDVDKYLAKSDIFAFTSLSEGFPNALSECQAFPLACISYDCPTGPSDLINHNINGKLIEMGNQDKYLTELQNLVDNSNVRDKFKVEGLKNRNIYSAKILAKNILKFLDEKS